jgi:multisubunit Na+/H+ antiporter MnhF subunit
MSPFFHAVTLGCLGALIASGALAMYRLALGPDSSDRAVAFDTLSMVFIGIVCTLCILWRSPLYFDAVWILTLVGFLGTAAVGRYLERGRLF